MFEHAYPTFAQSGEDRIVHTLFSMFSASTTLTYADLGAANPIGHNNTYLAYCLGGRGLLVEADPNYADAYLEHRPRDTHVRAAIVPSRLAGSPGISFNRNADPGMSRVLGAAPVSGVLETFTVPCVTVNPLLGEHFPDEIDLLSIDVEGQDEEILAELDVARFRPKAVVAENAHGDPVHRAIMESRGYRIYGSTCINTIYYWPPFFRL